MLSRLAFLAVAALLPVLAFAQPPPPNAPAAIPIDGGLGLLALAGGAYAVKRLRNKA
ncbi:MAG: hypothetical protein AAF845_02880 [Bacteroidota bacterium]